MMVVFLAFPYTQGFPFTPLFTRLLATCPSTQEEDRFLRPLIYITVVDELELLEPVYFSLSIESTSKLKDLIVRSRKTRKS